MDELYLIVGVSLIIFVMGIYGLASRRNAMKMLISAELLINAGLLNIIAFHHYLYPAAIDAQILAIFVIAIAAAEAAIGLALFLALHRIYGVPDLDVVKKLREVEEGG